MTDQQPHILFVDDEPRVLSGLRRMLRSQRSVWDMTFAAGPEEALAVLAERSCVAVVSDFRMPGMDGGMLLQLVRDRYPGTARLILSGHTDESDLLKVLLIAHEFVNKPCEAEEIVGAIDRIVALRPLFDNPDVTREVPGVTALPEPPSTLRDMLAAMDAGPASAAVVQVVERDPLARASLIDLVNSPSFTAGGRVTDVADAVALLGIRAVRSLLLVDDLTRAAGRRPEWPAGRAQWLVHRSLETALLARTLAEPASWADDAFTAALLREVGQLAMALARPTDYAATLAAWTGGDRALADLEEETYGVTHATVGGYLLALWGLPTTVLEVTLAHRGAGPGSYEKDLPSVVALAHAHVAAELGEVCGTFSAAASPLTYAQLDPVSADRLAAWKSERTENLR